MSCLRDYTTLLPYGISHSTAYIRGVQLARENSWNLGQAKYGTFNLSDVGVLISLWVFTDFVAVLSSHGADCAAVLLLLLLQPEMTVKGRSNHLMFWCCHVFSVWTQTTARTPLIGFTLSTHLSSLQTHIFHSRFSLKLLREFLCVI